MDVTKELASLLTSMTYEDFPKKDAEIAKEHFWVTVGVALAGSRESTGKIGIRTVKWWRKTHSTVMDGGLKTSRPNAAFTNGGISAHAVDLMTLRIFPPSHYNAALIPAVLALAEQVKPSGKKKIESYEVQ